MDGGPGTVRFRQIAPGGAGAHDPQDPDQHGPVIVRRATGRAARGRHQRRDPGPPRIGELGERGERLDGWIGDRVTRLRAPGAVVAFRIRLMPPAKDGPRAARGALLRRFAQRKEQAPDFGEREREQVGAPPFWASSRAAAWRTTAR
jgi:hypothetical protein